MRRCACLLLLMVLPMLSSNGRADVMKARFKQGSLHAYLLMRDESGKLIATGDVVNEPVGAAWRVRVLFKFRDGSVDDDTTVYMQHTVLRVMSDHHVQKGPSFPKPMDMLIDVAKKTVTWHDYHDGKDETKVEHMDLPIDLANGMVPWVMQNFPKGLDELKMGYVVASPKPRLVKFAFHQDGQESFHIGPVTRTAEKYRIHVELGGIAGVVAPMVGKEPPDLHAWVVHDTVPTFLKLVASQFMDGPVWTMELTAPVWAEPKQ